MALDTFPESKVTRLAAASGTRRNLRKSKVKMDFGSPQSGVRNDDKELSVNEVTQNGQNLGIRYIDSAQNSAISGMPTFMKSVKR